MSNAPNASGLSGISQPPAIAASTRPSRRSPSASPSATAPDAHEFAVERIGPRTSSAIPRLAGAAPPKTASARFGRDLADPLREIALVLLLGVGDAAERASRGRCRSAPGRRRRRRPARARVLERQPAGDQPELAEPVELPRGLRRHPRERVEVVDLCGDLRAERARVESVDARAPASGRAARPARNASTPVPAAVMMPIPVIQTRAGGRHRGHVRRGSARARALDRPRGLGGERLGDRLERGQRPSGDRPREPAIHERAPARGAAGANSCSMRDVAAGRASGSMCQVTSMPRSRPPTCTNRSRRAAGLRPRPRAPCDRQADAEDRDEGPARDEVHDERAVGAVARGPSSARSGGGRSAQRSTSRASPNTRSGGAAMSMAMVECMGRPITVPGARRDSAGPARDRRGRDRPSRDPSSHGRHLATRPDVRRSRTARAAPGTPGPATDRVLGHEPARHRAS